MWNDDDLYSQSFRYTGEIAPSVVYEMTYIFSVVVFKEAVEDSYKIDKSWNRQEGRR